MSDSILEISGVGKSFRQYKSEWRRILSWFGCSAKSAIEQWVLRDISFSISPGEAVGIIGQNGAGKSTLLKLITGTLSATEGAVHIKGRLTAILELGMGFNPEFTGRQNACVSAGLLGYSQNEISHAIPVIEAFAEIGDYFDQPLRTYSSGMQVRIAFSIITAFRPEILIIDEALSVGDAYFQHKCFAKIREFQKAGTTLLFVSHDPGAVKTLCTRALLLDGGKIIKDDLPDNVLNYYNALISNKEKKDSTIQNSSSQYQNQIRFGNNKALITHVELTNLDNKPERIFQVGEEARIVCEISFDDEIDSPTIGMLIRDKYGNDIFGTNTYHTNPIQRIVSKGERLQVTFSLPLNLGLGHYSVTTNVHASNNHLVETYDWRDKSVIFQVIQGSQNYFIGVAHLLATVVINESTYAKN